MISIHLHPKRDKRLQSGHNWVFSNEVAETNGNPEPGEVAAIVRKDGKILGQGYYNPHSLIACRFLTPHTDPIDASFYQNRIAAALTIRNRRYTGYDTFRVVHSESDGLPGLIIDKIGSVLVIQIHAAGAERHLEWIIAACVHLLSPDAIVLRNDSALRTLEGLPLYSRVAHGPDPVPLVDIAEHGITYRVDVQGGQKTGFFIDQRENRMAFRQFIKEGDIVLDAFCNDGGFALHAAQAGAGKVLAVDSSQPALDRAAVNAGLNGVEKIIRFENHDIMQWLPAETAGPIYDVINLDPPGFAKNKKTAGSALRGYLKLHDAAIRVLKPGGILATASCSHHTDAERFLDTVTEAARRTGRNLVLLHRGGQPADHPVLPVMPETEYLKFFIFAVG